MLWYEFKSPFKAFTRIILVGELDGIQRLALIHATEDFEPHATWQFSHQHFAEAEQQLLDYAQGLRTAFTLRLNPQGTIFQKQVWQALQTIPYGETRSYQQIAEQIGRPKSYRPVGNANHQNPIPIVIPCHRVITQSQKLSGYAYGADIKQQLLNLEKSRQHQPV